LTLGPLIKNDFPLNSLNSQTSAIPRFRSHLSYLFAPVAGVPILKSWCGVQLFVSLGKEGMNGGERMNPGADDWIYRVARGKVTDS